MATLRIELFIEKTQINIMSVMPCRLNGDVHEWFNEVVAVPSW